MFSPAYDNKIWRKYSLRTLEHKRENKEQLQSELGWVAEPRQPVLCIPTGMTDALGGKLFTSVLPGLLELPVSLVVRGRGSKAYGEIFTTLSRDLPHRIKILADDETSLRKMLAGSDISLFFAHIAESTELDAALAYGVIPVALSGPELDNYNPVQESGTAFTFDEATTWQCFAAIVRALETFKFPFDWRTIQRHAMEVAEKESKVEA